MKIEELIGRYTKLKREPKGVFSIGEARRIIQKEA